MVEEDGVLSVRKEGRIATVTLNYPRKGNALVPPLYGLFVEAMRELAEDDDIWVIVLTGSGKNFCSGGYVGSDGFYSGLDAGGQSTAAEPMRRTFHEMFQSIQRAVYMSEKPVIAMLNGLTAGEAVDLVLSADIRTGHAGSDIWFSFGYTGNTAYTGAAWLLPRLVGLSEASRILLTAERVSGTRARELGLVTTFTTPDRLEEETMALAERIAGLPPITLRLIKKEIHRGLEIGSFLSNLDITSMIEPIVQFTRDHMDAEEAIIEKRKPVVRGE
jgi:2-(1,2-epoxy-1,2-dihydrophenyl)acetyl-CoA isomerase